jgi:transcriptional regulator with XRE-family HTH domain
MKAMILNPIVVGSAIQKIREEKGLTQEVLSGLAGIGRTHLSAIERGERRPTLDTFYRISLALKMNASELMKIIEDEMNSPIYQ